MRICDLITPATRLQKATKRLQDAWRQTNESWNDPVSEEFQAKFLDPIIPQMQLALAAIHQLTEVLDRAERDCRDEQEVQGF
jgi:hypothetical protein